MANLKANLYYSTKKSDGKWTFAKANEKKLTTLAEGAYYVFFNGSDGKRKSEAVGSGDPHEALMALKRKRNQLEAVALGREQAPESESKPLAVRAAVAAYLEDCRDRIGNDGYGMSERSLRAYTRRLAFLMEFDGITPMSEVNEQYVKRFVRFLRRHPKKLSDRYVFNIVQALHTFLLTHGITAAKKVLKSISFEPAECRIYSDEELKKFLSECTEDESLLFRFFLHSMCRAREVAHTEKGDLLVAESVLHIRPKPHRKFRLKGKKSGAAVKGRKVPLPRPFMAELAEYSKRMDERDLLFGNDDGKVQGHFLRLCKDIAFRAGLNCGHCVNKQGLSCKLHPVCGRWTLHSFRKTGATRHHNSNPPVSVRRLQAWLGHEDIETTEMYLGVQDAADENMVDVVSNGALAAYC